MSLISWRLEPSQRGTPGSIRRLASELLFLYPPGVKELLWVSTPRVPLHAFTGVQAFGSPAVPEELLYVTWIPSVHNPPLSLEQLAHPRFSAFS